MLGSLLFEDKVVFIEKLKVEEGMVVMVGDGVNDVLVMVKSMVGIVMGVVGLDVVLEIVDIVLMVDKLENLFFVIGLSWKVKCIIK